MQDTALILVDFENEWLDRYSDYFVGDIERVLVRVNMLIDYCRKKGHRIIFTTHIEKDSTKAFAPKTKRVKIMRGLHKEKGDILIKKYKVSPFYKTSLERKLKGVSEVIVCGILTNLCVRSLVEGAYDRDFAITVVKDCCVAFDRETQEFTFNDLKSMRKEILLCDMRELIRQ
jgi:nicotinamidase-related amidase